MHTYLHMYETQLYHESFYVPLRSQKIVHSCGSRDVPAAPVVGTLWIRSSSHDLAKPQNVPTLPSLHCIMHTSCIKMPYVYETEEVILYHRPRR